MNAGQFGEPAPGAALHLSDLHRRSRPPIPWAEGETIPWHDPEFSRRMLREHLSQTHDSASRRSGTIDLHVRWLSGLLPPIGSARILDLGCGPGLYAQRFAAAGHRVTGIDFSPASIDYARARAAEAGLRIEYRLEDLRQADFGRDHDLAMLIFGEFNVFRPADARLLLVKAFAALAPGGTLVLEAHPFDAIRAIGTEPVRWYTAEAGLWSDAPYLCLVESYWDAARNAATTRHFIVDPANGSMARHSASMQAYTDEEYRALLESCGFGRVDFGTSLTGGEEGSQADLFVIQASKS